MRRPHGDTFELPELPFSAWEESKRTLHLYTQILGKVALALHPKLNHWWHATLQVSPRGLTTRAIPARDQLVDIALDLVDHSLVMRSSNGRIVTTPLVDGLSVASFYRAVMRGLADFGVTPKIQARPFDPAVVGSDIPFADDETHKRYQADYVHRFWQILLWVHATFLEFAGGFAGKASPVQLYWHSFDVAYGRFSGRETSIPRDRRSDHEAYSHDVISVGFWPGDADTPAPAFYGYAYPDPGGLAEMPLEPNTAVWLKSEGGSMALLGYDDLRTSADPDAALLAFLESVYLAGASKAGWDIEGLRHRFHPAFGRRSTWTT